MFTLLSVASYVSKFAALVDLAVTLERFTLPICLTTSQKNDHLPSYPVSSVSLYNLF